MDREVLRAHLAQAEDNVTLGEQHIAKQRALIEKLEGDGHDTVKARELLAVFEETQVLHVADRDRLLRELSKPQGWSS